MFSKKVISGWLAAVVLLTQSGCGLKTGEKAPEMAPPSFSGKGYSCVGQIPQHLERYVSDELSDTQITEFMQCLQKAFTTFVQLTRGKTQHSYAPNEIRRFLQTYFLRERPITDRLMNEFMAIKQVLVGGELTVITRTEIADLIEFLEEVRKEAIRIRPYLKYLNTRLIVNQDPKDIGLRLGEAYDTLRQSIRVLTLRINGGHRDYSFANLETLMVEFRGFVRWDEHFKDSKPVASWIGFLKTFKRLTNTQAPDQIQTGEWAGFLQTFARWYLAYIQYRVGVRDQPLLSGSGLQNVMHLAQEVFELIEEAIHRQPNKVISLQLINELVGAAQKLEWVPKQIRPASIERFTRALTERVFADEKAVNGRTSSEGLTLPIVALMRYEFFRWTAIQLKLEQEFYLRGTPDARQVRTPNLQHGTRLIPRDIQVKMRNIRDADWEHFQQVKKLMRPLFNENLERITLAHESEFTRQGLTHGFYNLSVMNLLRSSVALLFRGYSDARGARWDWNSGITSAQLQTFYDDIRDLAVDLQFADPRVINTGSRAFIEGNLFTFAGDGVAFDVEKSRLTFVESMQLTAFIYSGGRMSTDLYNDLAWKDKEKEIKNCAHGPKDLNGDPTLSRECVKRELADILLKRSATMPGLMRFLAGADAKQREMIVTNILDSAFSPKHSQIQWVERNELSIIAVVLHYLEAVVIRFDQNRNGMLSGNELRAAVPVFSGFIQRYAKDRLDKNLSARDAEGVFLYILAYKSFPTTWNTIRVWYLSYDMNWEFDFWGLKLPINFNQNISLSRAELSSVFRVIVAKLFETVPVAEQIRLLNNEAAPAPCQNIEEFKAGTCSLPGAQQQ